MSIKLVPVIMSSDLKGSIRGTCEIGDSGRSFNIAAAGGHGKTRRATRKPGSNEPGRVVAGDPANLLIVRVSP